MDITGIPFYCGKRFIMPGQIIRVEALSNYCKIYFEKAKPIVVAKVLQWFQLNLPAHLFVRVHKSHLVNRAFIKKINGEKQEILLLSNGEKITMSRRKKGALKQYDITVSNIMAT